MMKTSSALLCLCALLASGCGKEDAAPSGTSPSPKAESADTAAKGATPAPGGLTAIAIPADGKIENVQIDGKTVPMINIMDQGTVVLVDTDGVKPRSWEEQYKRKGDLPKGYFDLHKSDVNKNDKFDDDPVDQQGRWKMDEKGNIVRD